MKIFKILLMIILVPIILALTIVLGLLAVAIAIPIALIAITYIAIKGLFRSGQKKRRYKVKVK